MYYRTDDDSPAYIEMKRAFLSIQGDCVNIQLRTCMNHYLFVPLKNIKELMTKRTASFSDYFEIIPKEGDILLFEPRENDKNGDGIVGESYFLSGLKNMTYKELIKKLQIDFLYYSYGIVTNVTETEVQFKPLSSLTTKMDHPLKFIFVDPEDFRNPINDDKIKDILVLN